MKTVNARSLRSAVRQALAPFLYASAVALPAIPAAVLAADEKAEEVLITGSRVRTNGMESPNPITIVSMDELNLINPTSLVDALGDLPMFNGSSTVNNFDASTFGSGFSFFTSPGNGTLNLRGLGQQGGKRTLTLLDGRRVVSSTLFGGPSITLFPQQLMRSVEAVTGGATAAYGTDAVSGVVNYVLNTKFEGLRANARYGILENGRGPSSGGGIAGGFKLGNNTHVLLSAESSSQNTIMGRDGFDWYSDTRYMQNPDANRGNAPSNPTNIPRPLVVSRTTTLDGVIYFPTKASLGTYALDRNGNATPFVLGSYSDATNNSLEGGGSGTINDEFTRQMRGENHNRNYFGYVDHDVNDQLNVYVQGMQGKTFSKTIQVQNLAGSETVVAGADGISNANSTTASPMIFSGNPFIPANIQQLMTANAVPYIKIGKSNAVEDIAKQQYVLNDTQVASLTTGFSYKIKSDGFLNDWMIKGWYQGGHTDTAARQYGYIRSDRFYLAVDAVKDASGNTVCNVNRFPNAAANAAFKNCVPYNVFGRGRASQTAIDWVTGYDAGQQVKTNGYYVNNETGIPESMYYEYESGREKARIIDIHQDAWELSADGDLFKGFGAGPIGAAVGLNWREDSFVQNVVTAGGNPAVNPNVRPNPTNSAAEGRRGIPTALAGVYVDMPGSNVPFDKGSIEVKEAFSELNVPLLAGKPFIKELVVGAAARWADYEGPGQVWSWKTQFSWRINDEFRLRGTVSHDVRAANMAERYDRTGTLGLAVFDTVENPNAKASANNAYAVQVATFGNPKLKPESAETQTAGFVFQPARLKGLQLSVDWYRTFVTDNISTLGGGALNADQQIIDACVDQKDAFSCAMVIREGDVSTFAGAPTGLKRISQVLIPYVNQQFSKVMGVDFELSYNREINVFGGGERLGVRFLGSYLDTNAYKNAAASPLTEQAGPTYAPWQTNLNLNYSRGNWNGSLGTSYEWGRSPGPFDINNLTAGTWTYEDVTVHYQMLWNGSVGYNYQLKGGSSLRFGLNVQNLFDKDPRAAYNTPDGVRGDLLGRRYSLSMNYSY